MAASKKNKPKTTLKKKGVAEKTSSKKKSLTKKRKEKEKLKKIDSVLELIESGLSLRKALLISKVGKDTFYNWVVEKEMVDGELANVNQERYARATNERADAIMDEAYDIADDNRKDNEVRYDSNGVAYVVEDKEYTSRSKMKVDLRKWHLSKLQPKKYGDKIEVEQKSDITISFK